MLNINRARINHTQASDNQSRSSSHLFSKSVARFESIELPVTQFEITRNKSVFLCCEHTVSADAAAKGEDPVFARLRELATTAGHVPELFLDLHVQEKDGSEKTMTFVVRNAAVANFSTDYLGTGDSLYVKITFISFDFELQASG